MQKEISILREVLKDSVLTPAQRQSILRQIADLELSQAVSNLAAMCEHIDEGKRPLACGSSQTHFGFHSR